MLFDAVSRPSLISTDMAPCDNLEVQSLAVTMSKFIYLGLELDQVIAMTTINPARALKEEDRRGSLTPGMPADITVIEARKGDYSFRDARRGDHAGEVLLGPTMVFKTGRMTPACSGSTFHQAATRLNADLLRRGDIGKGGAGTREDGPRDNGSSAELQDWEVKTSRCRNLTRQ